jgi:hypothetical protein
MRMARRGSQAGRRGGGRSPKARSNADEALLDAQAEVEDTAAALEAGGSAGASRSVGFALAAAAPPLPAALLQRRYDKEKTEKENAIKEKEFLQKQLDDMKAQLELAKANPGDVVQITRSNIPVPRKICFKQLFY